MRTPKEEDKGFEFMNSSPLSSSFFSQASIKPEMSCFINCINEKSL
jgi:hypothetical protein